MSNEERLFGLDHAEVLYFDIDTVWEAEIEPFLGSEAFKPWTVEEWTVLPPKTHFPSASVVIEYIIEHAHEMGEVSENWDVPLGPHLQEITEEVDKVIDLMASKVRMRMADQIVATHELTLKDGDLYVNGKLWRKDAVT